MAMDEAAAHIWRKLYAEGDGSAGEWWATDRNDQFVIEIGGCAYRITVDEVTELPTFTPAEWMEANGRIPHPFGYKCGGK